MRKMWPWLTRLASIALVALFTACPNPTLDEGGASRGAVEILLSDASPPAVALDGARALSIEEADGLGSLEVEAISAVWVRILSVQLCDAEAETWLTVADFGPEGKEWELLALAQDIDSLGLRELEPGLYGQIRLILSGEHRVVVDGVEHPLRVPSGEQTGIKLAGDFEIAAAGLTRISVDFVASESVHKTGAGEYLLKPVIRIKEVVTTPFLVDEDFEPYAIDAYPSEWGWYPLWSGAGVARAVEAPTFEGGRAFQQQGYTNWVRSDGIDLDLSSRDRLSYGAALMVPSGSATGGHIGFFKRTQPNESIEFNSLALNPGSEIMALGTAWVGTGVLCQADTWYEARVDLDYAHGLMDVWLDGVQVLDDAPARGRDESQTFFTGTGWTNTVAGISTLYVDALRIY